MMLLYLIIFVELFICDGGTVPADGEKITYRLPAEWEPHQKTFMIWPRLALLRDDAHLAKVRKDLINLSNVIVQFEPVIMFADPSQVTSVQAQVDPKIEVVAMKVDDLWARDTLPMFVSKVVNGNESISGIVFNFNGWGNKQFHDNDGLLAKRVLQKYELESITANIISEGGACQTDGKGTLLAPKSSLVNANRNSQSIEEIEIELKRLFGIRKIIWFESVMGEDLTDGHIDCLVRYIRPGVVLLDRPFPGSVSDSWAKSSDQAYSVLMNSTDADGNPFEIIEVFEPDRTSITDETPGTYVTSYLNFLIGNGFVAVPAFGESVSDLNAQVVIQAQFPDRKVVLIPINAIAAVGGGIHCATMQYPAISKADNAVPSLPLLATFLILPIATSLLAASNVFSIFKLF